MNKDVLRLPLFTNNSSTRFFVVVRTHIVNCLDPFAAASIGLTLSLTDIAVYLFSFKFFMLSWANFKIGTWATKHYASINIVSFRNGQTV